MVMKSLTQTKILKPFCVSKLCVHHTLQFCLCHVCQARQRWIIKKEKINKQKSCPLQHVSSILQTFSLKKFIWNTFPRRLGFFLSEVKRRMEAARDGTSIINERKAAKLGKALKHKRIRQTEFQHWHPGQPGTCRPDKSWPGVCWRATSSFLMWCCKDHCWNTEKLL